ncbi:hypothetical protein [Sinorhizobium meliloti]|nr:hypothetical protein [Sinorhizobium meliloti]
MDARHPNYMKVIATRLTAPGATLQPANAMPVAGTGQAGTGNGWAF